MTDSHHLSPTRPVAIHGDGDQGIALLWHGRGPHEAYALGRLAETIAAHGLTVLAADWDSRADDHGRADLEASLLIAQRTAGSHGIDPGRLVVAGWSLGATAALGLALCSRQPPRTVLIAPGYAPRATNAFSGEPLPEVFPPGRGQPIDVLWGNCDEIVDAPMAGRLVSRLRHADWTVTAHELDADHSGVVGMRFDADLDRYVVDPMAADAMAAVSAVIVAASRLA